MTPWRNQHKFAYNRDVCLWTKLPIRNAGCSVAIEDRPDVTRQLNSVEIDQADIGIISGSL